MPYNECMKKLAVLAAWAALALPPLTAGEAEMNQLLSDWQRRVSAWQQAVQAAADPEAQAAVPKPEAESFAAELWGSISAQTGNRRETVVRGKGRKRREEVISVPVYEFERPWALPGIIWFLNHPEALSAAFDEDEQNHAEFYADAIARALSRVHFSNPAIRDICPVLANNSGVREYELMQKIYNRNADAATRAVAALSLSLMLNNPMISGVEGSAAMVRGKRIYYLKQALLLGDPKTPYGNSTLGDMAAEQTYRLRFLSEGCIPPQIRLRAADGRMVSCPEEGKVNLLIFWSPEEASGAALAAQLDKLNEQYPELVVTPIAPFRTPEVLQQELQTVPGMDRSLVDDEKGSAGIAYRVSSIPLTVLISKRSSVLYIGAPGVQLQTALDAALKAQQPNRPRVTIEQAEKAAPVIQPGSRPRPADAAPISADAAAPPALREMPEF